MKFFDMIFAMEKGACYSELNKARQSWVARVPLLSHIFLVLLFALTAVPALAQDSLRQQIRAIAAEAHGKVSVACSLPGSALNCDLNPKGHAPMQSVFKLPLALTVLHQVEQGRLSLDQPVRFLPEDRILPHVHSPLQDKYPAAGVDVPLRELLRLAVSESDNVAADILLRLAGGPKAVSNDIATLGITGFHFQDNEAVLHHNVSAQYRNWLEPVAAIRLLHVINDSSRLTPEHTDLLLGWCTPAVRTKRLDGDLPNGTRVAHKSGTSGVDNGVAHATNDIGLIPLPDGRRIAIAVFVIDSTADEAIRENVIARIGRAVHDAGILSANLLLSPANFIDSPRALSLSPWRWMIGRWISRSLNMSRNCSAGKPNT